MEQIVMLLLVLSVVVPVGVYFIRGRKNGKLLLVVNLVAFFSVVIGASILIMSGGAAAAGEAVQTVGQYTKATDGNGGMLYISAALVTGISGIAAGIAVAASASAALGAISENEKVFGKALAFVGLAEGIAIYGMVVALMMLSKV